MTAVGGAPTPASPVDERPSRLVSFANGALGASLVLVCILAGVAALSYLLLLLGQASSSAAVGAPADGLLSVLGAVFTVILAGIMIRYGYYYYCWWVSRRSFASPRWVDAAELGRREVPFMKVQITTKGGALPVVERSIRILEAACARHPWLNARMSVEVITERQDESDAINRDFAKSILRVEAVRLPDEYRTPNGSRLKARALHYLVERRREGWNAREGRTFVVHFDEETVLTEPHLLLLVDYLTTDPRPISQGPILYPLEWTHAPWICRAIESTRPFGCSECARVMQNPPPPHLHGSNLVVDEAVEDRVGWDFGTIDGQPFIAEDLLFGLRAYALLGEGAFGWHGATALEQPPLSLFWAVQQRMRWVLGALQGLRAMWVKPDYEAMDRKDRLRLGISVYARIATYALGFPVGLTGLLFFVHPFADTPDVTSPFFALRIGFLLSAVGWIVSYQIGMWRNLMYQGLPWYDRLWHHAVMLMITPIVGLCETIGPFVALVRWLVGSRAAHWTPTPKLADAVAAATSGGGSEPAAEQEAPAEAPIPAWVYARPRRPGDDEPPPPPRPRRPAPTGPVFRTARVLWPIGACVLLFIAYEFAATDLLYGRSQSALLTSFRQNVANGAVADPNATPAEGDPVALLEIPSIGVDGVVVVDGTSPEDLRAGPGHLRSSSLPGEFGNVVVGRRETYGGPFRNLDRLGRGDVITVTSGSGSFVYRVDSVDRSGAGTAGPLDGTLDSRLTLVTSDPAFLPDSRLSVVAKLQGRPLDVPNRGVVPVAASELGLAGDTLGLGVALFWGVLLAAAVWVVSRVLRRWPLRVRYLVGAPVVVTLGVLVMTSIDAVLPGTL